MEHFQGAHPKRSAQSGLMEPVRAELAKPAESCLHPPVLDHHPGHENRVTKATSTGWQLPDSPSDC